MYKIGYSKDIHKLKFCEDSFILCGNYKIFCNYKTIANSDGDVLLHALSESFLGAIGDRDIGFYFDKKGHTTSLEILNFALLKIKNSKYKISNIDITIENNEITLSKYYENIISSLSKILNIDSSLIGLKFTTNENTYNKVFIAYCVVLLINI